MTTKVPPRKPSPLQRNILIVLAALDSTRPGPVATLDIESLLEKGGEKPVYGNNLRASCRRMEKMGWLRMLRAKNLQLAVEITATGRELAMPLLAAERERVESEQRAMEIRVLPLSRGESVQDTSAPGVERLVKLENTWYLACRGDYVIRLDGTTCLQLWNAAGQLSRLAGDPLQVATWLQACHAAGIVVRMQINESRIPEEGEVALATTTDLTDTWYRQLEAELQALGITGLTDAMRQSVVSPEDSIRSLPAPARLLHVLRESEEAFPLTADGYEKDTEAALAERMVHAGFTPAQATELQLHRIRWPLMNEEEFSRRELNTLLDELEQCQLYCNRDQLVALVFSPVRKASESWTERLQWLLSTDGFGLYSPLSREAAERALNHLAVYVGKDAAEQLATHVTWGVNEPPEKS